MLLRDKHNCTCQIICGYELSISAAFAVRFIRVSCDHPQVEFELRASGSQATKTSEVGEPAQPSLKERCYEDLLELAKQTGISSQFFSVNALLKYFLTKS